MASSAVAVADSGAKEYKIPATFVAIGIAIYLLYGLIVAGMTGLEAIAEALPILIVVKVVLGLIACFLTAKIMGANFGYLASAIVKLAAIFIFPAAVTFFIPYVGWLIALVLYWGLLEWLFELDAIETIVIAIVIWMVNALGLMLIAGIGFATMR